MMSPQSSHQSRFTAVQTLHHCPFSCALICLTVTIRPCPQPNRDVDTNQALLTASVRAHLSVKWSSACARVSARNVYTGASTSTQKVKIAVCHLTGKTRCQTTLTVTWSEMFLSFQRLRLPSHDLPFQIFKPTTLTLFQEVIVFHFRQLVNILTKPLCSGL